MNDYKRLKQNLSAMTPEKMAKQKKRPETAQEWSRTYKDKVLELLHSKRKDATSVPEQDGLTHLINEINND